MPIPTPRSSEPQREYITRCYEEIKDEYDKNRAFSICYTKWKEKKMERIAKLSRKPRI